MIISLKDVTTTNCGSLEGLPVRIITGFYGVPSDSVGKILEAKITPNGCRVTVAATYRPERSFMPGASNGPRTVTATVGLRTIKSRCALVGIGPESF